MSVRAFADRLRISGSRTFSATRCGAAAGVHGSRVVGSAFASNWLEKTVYLMGPALRLQAPGLRRLLGARHHPATLCDQGRPLLELGSADRGLRPDPRGRVPALGRRHDPAPLLHRPRAGLRRHVADGPLFDHRGRRHDRRELGRASGAWSASTATGPTIRPARPPVPDASRLRLRELLPVAPARLSAVRILPAHGLFYCYFVLDLFPTVGTSPAGSVQ